MKTHFFAFCDALFSASMDLNYYSVPNSDKMKWIPSGIVFVWPCHIDEFTDCNVNWRIDVAAVGKLVDSRWTAKAGDDEKTNFYCERHEKASQLSVEKTHRKWEIKFENDKYHAPLCGGTGCSSDCAARNNQNSIMYNIYLPFSSSLFRVRRIIVYTSNPQSTSIRAHADFPLRFNTVMPYIYIQRPIKINEMYISVWTLKWFVDEATHSLYTTCTRADEIYKRT